MKPDALVKALQKALAGEVRVDEPMDLHTTWRVGGPADYFIVPQDRTEVATALEILEDAAIPWMVVGAGSNLLVRDGGIRGAVLSLGRLRGLIFEEGRRVRAEGGLPLMSLIREAARRGLAGLEELAGIPGTLGGGVAMNVGAGRQEIGALVRDARVAQVSGESYWDAQRFDFAYRHSALTEKMILTEVTLELEAGESESLERIVEECLAKKRAAQGVGFPNAGSVFKNPTGLSAWKCIDEAGLRGKVVGDAEISAKHTNFIVNRGRATARDILTLMEMVVETVHRTRGVGLEPEVRIVGED